MNHKLLFLTPVKWNKCQCFTITKIKYIQNLIQTLKVNNYIILGSCQMRKLSKFILSTEIKRKKKASLLIILKVANCT